MVRANGALASAAYANSAYWRVGVGGDRVGRALGAGISGWGFVVIASNFIEVSSTRSSTAVCIGSAASYVSYLVVGAVTCRASVD